MGPGEGVAWLGPAVISVCGAGRLSEVKTVPTCSRGEECNYPPALRSAQPPTAVEAQGGRCGSTCEARSPTLLHPSRCWCKQKIQEFIKSIISQFASALPVISCVTSVFAAVPARPRAPSTGTSTGRASLQKDLRGRGERVYMGVPA